MQLAQDSQLMNLGRAQMQICLALNDHLSCDRLSGLTAVIPQGLSQTNTLWDANRSTCIWSTLFLRPVSAERWMEMCIWHTVLLEKASWLDRCQDSSLDDLNLRSGLVVNLTDTKAPSYRSLTVKWTWGGGLDNTVKIHKNYKSKSQFISSFTSEICLLLAVICNKKKIKEWGQESSECLLRITEEAIFTGSLMHLSFHGSRCLATRLGRKSLRVNAHCTGSISCHSIFSPSSLSF